MTIWLAAVVTVTAATGARAGLEVDPGHPHYFRDAGRPVYLLGASDRDALFMWRTAKGFDWEQYLRTLHDNGLNYVRQDVTAWQMLNVPTEYPAQFTKPAWPFLRAGPGPASDGKPRFDLARFDERFFGSRIRPFLARAQELGIYVELTLFDRLGGREWPNCLCNDANNVNGLGIGPGDFDADWALDNPELLSIQEDYVSMVLAETAEFGNVIYEVCNEGGGRDWVTHFVGFIHGHPHHPSHLVSAGEQTSAFDPVSGPNDIVIKHRGGGGLYASDADVKSHHDALLRFRGGKPVIHNEYFLYANRSADDPNFVRKMMWGDFTAGGHSNFYDFAHWRGSGRTVDDGEPSRPPPAEILDGARHLRWLIDRVPFWTMEPADACVSVTGANSYAMALASKGRCCVVYFVGEPPLYIELTVPDGDYSLRWYDPKTGALSAASRVPVQGDRLVPTVPEFEQDVVLWLEKP